tara:strand:- start:12 stop:611 length:600 start_codon:yes stop_codon:yes gene_type:complete
MNIELILFFIFSSLLLYTSIRVITSNNPVKSAVNLVFSFFFSAVLWLLLNAEFLSVILILVYVGAVMVLFLFVVMMLDINLTEIGSKYVKHLFSGLTVFILTITILVLFFKNEFQNSDKNILNEIVVIGDDNTKNLGYVLYTEYIFAFEIAAVILLLGIISAITLTQNKNKNHKYQNPQEQIFANKDDRLSIIKDEDLK